MKGKTRALYILIAFVASVLLWIYVVGVERPQKEDVITGVPVTFVGEDAMFEDYDLIITSDKRPTVSLTVMGSIRDVAALNTNKESIIVEASLSNIKSTGLKQISYTVTLPNDDVTLLEQAPYYLSVRVEKVSMMPVEVKINNKGSVAEEFIAKTPVIEPASLQISGPEDTVSRIDHAEVVWTRENMDQTLTLDLGYVLYDAEGAVIPMDGLTANYDVVSVTIPIQKTKSLPLTVGFTDGGGASSANATYTVDPPYIEIAGEPSVIDGLNSLEVANVNLAEVVGAWSQSYEIQLPNGVESISGESECTVTVELTGLKVAQINCDNITAIHAPEGYTAEPITRERQVTLRGPAADIDQIEMSNVRIVADLEGQDIVERGRYTVGATVYVDGFTTVSELYPVTIVVEVVPEGGD